MSPLVRRLVNDGVDVVLGDLFLRAAPPEQTVADGGRARSAVEGFLFRRLDTLPETAGRFRLNAELLIPLMSAGGWRLIRCARTRGWPSS